MEEREGHAFHELDMVLTGYGERGICTVLYWSDGTSEEVPVKMKTVVQRIAEAYGKTPQSIRRHWRGLSREKFGKMAILAISPAVVLMPVKLAAKMVGRDAAIGYVNLAQPIRFLAEKDGNGARSRIVFQKSLHALLTEWTCRTLKKHCTAAWLFFLEEHSRYVREKEIMERANSHLEVLRMTRFLH